MLNAFGASITGLFLLLAVCLAVPAGSTGVWFELFHVAPPPPCCVDGSPLVVEIRPGATFLVNGQVSDHAKATHLVAASMERRAERAVYLKANDAATVQEVAGLTGDLASSTEDLHIGLITHQQEIAITHSYGRRVLVDLYQLEWPQCPGGLVPEEVPILAGCK
jgi:biopolymer transport protein ExbD